MRSTNACQAPDRVEAGLFGYGGYWLWLLLVALTGISFPGGFVLGQGTNTDDGRGLYHFGDRVRRAARLEPDDPGRRGRYWLMQAVQRRRPVPGHPGHHRIFCGTFSTVLGTKS